MDKRECFGKYVNSSSTCYACSDEADCIAKTCNIDRPNKVRPSKDEYYLNIALAVSKRSTCLRRHYGCVIVNNDEIISTGYNGSARGENNCCDIGECPRINMPHNSGDYSDCPAVHAEQNAMLSASRKEMLGSTMYLYGEELGNGFFTGTKTWNEIDNPEPCPICSRIIKNSGIRKVVSKSGTKIFN